MAPQVPELTLTKVKGVAVASLEAAKGELPEASDTLEALKPKSVDARAKALFRILIAGTGEKDALVAVFFKSLRENIEAVLKQAATSPKAFGFETIEAFCDELKKKMVNIRARAKTLSEFKNGMEGRKWWFIGKTLWEGYVKNGPFRTFLNETAQDALKVVNEQIRTDSSYRMVDAWGKPVNVTQEFRRLRAAVEFRTADGREFLDFGHIAENKQGYWVIPTPTEIKQLMAAGEVAEQFGEFVPRVREGGNKILVRYEGTDAMVELDPRKLVFDPNARNQIVAMPSRAAWGSVKKPTASPDIDINVGTTTKGGGFVFWKFEVSVSRTLFEKLYEAIFIGIR